ncbi:glutaminase [Novispirillum itersonii]|uniref:Glutaminase n=1 Tax=Novispirillum itersonii TaxID=189 RepID=A0A7W9ZHX0_NOVIT|nr:glutaminase [Novispirillum itersonii]MBB6210569.1 glutaminase [Novispirillum itersonii]
MSFAYQSLLDRVHAEVAARPVRGKVADYIPALARIDASRFGMALALVDGRSFVAGDATEPFSIQSMSKLFTLVMAQRLYGDELWQRVGREPSGTAFNSLVQLEHEDGFPRNPFINAGALAVTNALVSRYAQPERAILDFMAGLSGRKKIFIDEEVARSEEQHGDRNRAIAYFLKAHNRFENDVAEVTRTYFRQCAIPLTCQELAQAALFLANNGCALDGTRILSPAQTRQTLAVMLTCGLYDGVGDFVFRVGLPAKSGVGGGIIAILPGVGSLCVWSPPLDARGNSAKAIEALELIAGELAVVPGVL